MPGRTAPLLTAVALIAAASAALLVGCDDATTSGAGAGGGAGGTASTPGGGTHLLEDPQLGDPELTSALRISFAPGGVLLVADGASDRIVAIETGDVESSGRSSHVFERVDQLAARVAKAIEEGSLGNQVWIHDVAVNPISWRVYVAASHYGSGETAIVWLDGDGQVYQMPLDHVVYAAVDYPVPNAGSNVQEVGWIDGFLTAATMNQVGRLVAYASPIEHGGLAKVSNPRFYHRGYGIWMTDLAADGIALLSHQEEPWLLAAFPDGPLVRFGVGVLSLGLELTNGVTVCDFGIGRLVRDMEYYERHGEGHLLASVYNLAYDGQVRAARIGRPMLMQVGAVNEDAPLLFDFEGTSLSALAERLEDLDGAERLAIVGNGPQVVVMRQDALEWLQMP